MKEKISKIKSLENDIFQRNFLSRSHSNSKSKFKQIPKMHHNYQKVLIGRRHIYKNKINLNINFNHNINNPQNPNITKSNHKNQRNISQYLNQQISNLLNDKTISQNSIILIKQPTILKKFSIQVNTRKKNEQQNIKITQQLKERRILKLKNVNTKNQRVKTEHQQNYYNAKKKQSNLNSKIVSLQLKAKKITQQLSIQQLVKPLEVQDQKSKINIEIQKKIKLKQQIVNIQAHRRFRTQSCSQNQKYENGQSFKSTDFQYGPKSKLKQKYSLIQSLNTEGQQTILKRLNRQDIKSGIGPWITKGHIYQRQFVNFFH